LWRQGRAYRLRNESGALNSTQFNQDRATTFIFFFSPENLRRFCFAAIVSTDGTFDSCPALYSRLFTLHIFDDDELVTLVKATRMHQIATLYYVQIRRPFTGSKDFTSMREGHFLPTPFPFGASAPQLSRRNGEVLDPGFYTDARGVTLFTERSLKNLLVTKV